MKIKITIITLVSLLAIFAIVFQSCKKDNTPACGGLTNLIYGGQIYDIVEIGNQCWMAENLNYQSAFSWWYHNSSANGDVYGRLYTWNAALIACPNGWHLPSDDEWKTLEMTFGMSQTQADNTGWRGKDEGREMKSTSGWNSNANGIYSNGFNALPGGYRESEGSFFNLGSSGYWWSSTDNSGMGAWHRGLYSDFVQIFRYYYSKSYGRSVRCLKN